MPSRCFRLAFSLASFSLISAAAADGQSTWYVDVANCPGPGSGTQADPFCSIQDGINAAVGGDEVVVAQGTYYELINPSGKAITLRSTGGPETTIIDGQGSGTVVTCSNGEGPNTVLQGFTIAGGNSTTNGGGMYNGNSSPTVTDCTFSGNSAEGNGGGMFISQGSPTLTRCTFRENTADFGGALFNAHGSPTLTDCTFADNVASASAGGMYNYAFPGQPSATLIHCAFNENSAESSGGAMRNWDSSPTLTRCDFYYNHVMYSGAGMANGGASSPTLTGCLFLANRTDTLFAMWDCYGGGMSNFEDSSPILVNCAFLANSATSLYPSLSHGGALANSGHAGPTLINCTLNGNHANLGHGLFNEENSSPTVRNSILWNGGDEAVIADSASLSVTYSNVEGNWPGVGNIDADPLLDDVWLLPGSPCIDAGDNTAVPPDITTDLDGYPRFVDDTATPDTGNGSPPIVDMGADEFVPLVPGDTNCDGVLNFDDVEPFVLALSDPAGFSGCDLNRADMNGDNLANGTDIQLFVAALAAP